jgi:hypothetical protein
VKTKGSVYQEVLKSLGGVSTIDEMYAYARKKRLVVTTEASFYLGVSREIRKGFLMGSPNDWVALLGHEIPDDPPPYSLKAEQAFLREPISEREAESLWRRMSAVLHSFRMFEMEKEHQYMTISEKLAVLERKVAELEAKLKTTA